MRIQKEFRLLAILFIAIPFLFASCKEDEKPTPDVNPSDSTYLSTERVLILHEGSFMASNATIGAYSPADEKYNPAEYKEKNGAFIGDVLQSANTNEGSIYAVLNGSNSVKVLDSATLSVTATIEHESIVAPRNITFSGGKAFLTVWGPYTEDYTLDDSKVVAIDLRLNKVSDIIATGEGVEDIEAVGNQVLVTRNYFGAYHHLSFINSSTMKVTADITLPEGPSEILVDSEGTPWVICTSGSIAKIDVASQSVANSYPLDGSIFGDAELIGKSIYYLQGNQVMEFNTETAKITGLFSTPDIAIPYGFGVDALTLEIYIADGVDYAGEGKVLRYSKEGELIDDFTSGILPTGFIFQARLNTVTE